MTEIELKLATAYRAHTTELFKLIGAIIALITAFTALGATGMYWYLKFTNQI